MRPAILPLALLVLASAAGCGDPTPAPAAPSPPPGPGLPSGAPLAHPPMASPHGATSGPAGGITRDRFHAPGGWEPQAATSSMRLLQYRLPRAEGDSKDGEAAVFTNIMGSTRANIDRWRGQFSTVEQGRDTLEEIADGVKGKVTLLDITGKYSGQMGPAAGGTAPAPAETTRMIAAVAESPEGVWFVKALGPPATMEKWAESVREFVLDAAKK